MANQSTFPAELLDQFHALDRRIRRADVLRGLGGLLLLVGALAGIALLADWLWGLPTPMRLGALGLSAGFIVIVGWRSVVRPAFQRRSLPELAAVVESAHPELKGRLVTLAEWNDPETTLDHESSALMRRLLERQTLKSIDRVQFGDVISTRRSRRTILAGLAAVAVLFLPWFIQPTAYGQLWSRLLFPWGEYRNPTRLTFQIEDGNRAVAKGDDVTLRVRANSDLELSDNKLPPAIRLVWQEDGGGTDDRLLEFEATTNSWILTRSRVHRSFTMFVDHDGQASPEYRVEVHPRPEITGATLEVFPPSYTGMPAQTFDGLVGDIPVFEHSRMIVKVESSLPIESARWVWLQTRVHEFNADPETPLPDATPIPLTLTNDGRTATAEWIATHGGTFTLELAHANGLTNLDETYRNLAVIPDLPPQLTIIDEPVSDRVRPDDVFLITAAASDDVAIEALELHLDLPADRHEVQSVPAETLSEDQVEHAFRIDLSTLNLEPGEVLTYSLRAADGRKIPGPQETWSRSRRLTLRTDAPSVDAAKVAHRQQNWRKTFDDIRKDLADTRQEVESLHDEAVSNRKEDREFESDSEIGPTAEREAALADRLEQLGEELADHPLFEQVADEFQKTARENLEPAAAELTEAPGQEIDEKVATLDRNQQQLANAEQQLDAAAREFELASALERDLQEIPELAREAEKLADQSEKLADDQAAADQEEDTAKQQQLQDELADRQEELAADQAELENRLDDLLDRRPELLDAARRDELEQLQQLIKEAERLAKAEDQLAETLEEDAQKAAEAAEELAKRQAELAKAVEELAKQEAKSDANENQSINPQPAREAAEALERGDLAEAEQKNQQLAEQIERLLDAPGEDATENERNSSQPQTAAGLAQKQQELRQQTENLSKNEAATAEDREELKSAQEQLAKQVGELPNSPQENAAGDPQASPKRTAQDAMQQASEALDNDKLDDAQSLQKTAEKALQELAKQQPNSKTPQGPIDPETANKMQQLADEMRDLQEEIEQLRREQGATEEAEDRQAQETTQNQQADTNSATNENRPADSPMNQDAAADSSESSESQNSQEANQNPADNTEATADMPPQQSQNSETGSQPNSNNADEATSNETTNEQTNSEGPQNSEPESNSTAENAEPASQSNQQQASEPSVGQQLAEQQRQLAQQAAQLALDVARERGAESEAAQNSLEMARRAEQAARAMESGQPQQASQAAEQSASAADQTAEQLGQPNGNSPANTELQQQAEQLANAQREQQQSLQQAASSPASRRSARQAGQESLNQATRELSRQLAEAARNLNSQPLNLEEQGLQAVQQAQAADDAQGSMQQTSQSLGQGNDSQAAQSAREAAESLRQAAGQAASSADDSADSGSSPVPGELARQLAEAKRQLAEAQQQMAQRNQSQNGQQTGEPSNSESQPQQNAPGQNSESADSEGSKTDPDGSPNPMSSQASSSSSKPSNQPGQQSGNSPSQSSQSLKQAAEALQQAARSMQPSQPSSQQASSEPGQSSQSLEGGDGSGTQADTDIHSIEQELKRRARREWGQLPGNLRTEILQGSQRKPNGDYAKLIKWYSEEIQKAQENKTP
ncbi:hypothetical protein [Thalassoroseus pseudoceratinae]|uniref:hypothetical protein n=1 Tax=Thalassoroseus pseudoceratinae TaxID=2713176 RepID=UPI00142345A9|nr:hypothetical protein [Thalassoroseus pseudoceratinae]